MTKRFQGGSEIVTDDAVGCVPPNARQTDRARPVLSMSGLKQSGRFTRASQTRVLSLFQHPGS